jgi:Fe-S oxidoreductase
MHPGLPQGREYKKCVVGIERIDELIDNSMKFDWFVLPFTVGLTFVLTYICIRFFLWIKALQNEEIALLRKHFFSKNIYSSIKEIFYESLLHRKLFRKNPLLGYMHMSLALGWLFIIVLGNIEIKFFAEYTVNPPYVPIFLRYFEPTPSPHFFGQGSNFLMDLILLVILSGVVLAIFKRFRPKTFGMSKTTNHNGFDKTALFALWLIFPLRFLAESLTSGTYNNGSFLTGSFGRFLAHHINVGVIDYPVWWAYSTALGIFFLALPFSRYMHIPAEMLLIIFRNAGIRAKAEINSYSQVEIRSCSRCGVCIDSCQLSQVGVAKIQPTYFIREIRYNTLKKATTDNCLVCGRCNVECPVGIDSSQLRITKRIEQYNYLRGNFSYVEPQKANRANVLYFAGCMTHLTPGIKNSMTKILDQSGDSWQFLDKDGSVCCGRPLMLAGQVNSAKQLIEKNKESIQATGAKTLVTSCPICFKIFKDEYQLGIEVLHHSQYILRLIEENKIEVVQTNQIVMYHDPCELGRHSGIYIEPRKTIGHVAELMFNNYSYENSLCCGSCLGDTRLSSVHKKEIAVQALQKMGVTESEMLVTSCPLCKKSFECATDKPVVDIAQLVAKNMLVHHYKKIQESIPAEQECY